MKASLSVSLAFGALLNLSATATADTDKSYTNTISGEGSLSGGFATGNSETADFGAGLKLNRDTLHWRQSLEFTGDYGETEGQETRNRQFGVARLDRKLTNPRASAYVRGTFEVDAFSGFTSRAFLGVGLGYIPIENDRTKLALRAGPGYSVDNLRTVFVDGNVTERGVDQNVALDLGANYSHKLTDTLKFSNDTDVTVSEITTNVTNTLGITSQIIDDLSLKLSHEIRHDTDPLDDELEPTDTATRISLVYRFGAD